jgi:hypothetical protein
MQDGVGGTDTFEMKRSEKNIDKAEGKIFRKGSPICVEERFYLTTKYLFFAAICNRKRFLEVPIRL